MEIHNWNGFLNLAKRMRCAQVYFEDTGFDYNGEKKKMEKEFDDAVKRIESAMANGKQGALL